ncbi:MAG TPA: hypothetical protein VFP72_14675 [Kineosporiaceae bacterium]|nr:hypothetical protein [Kineosporiaceae bacterium]
MTRDPWEGVAPDGTIVTGAARTRVPAAFEPVLAAVLEAVRPTGPCSVYVYGSVACGQAVVGRSDLDLLTVGLDRRVAADLGAGLSARFRGLVRGVEFSAAAPDDFAGEGDREYGNRVFLRHYGVHLSGPDPGAGWPACPADARAARGQQLLTCWASLALSRML